MSERRGSISFRDVSKEYPATEVSPALLAVDHVSFEAEAGSFVSIIGESGCGKTSLLRILAGLEQPSGGSVEIDACPVTGPDPKCGMVFQNNILFPWLTVRENVAFGPKRMGRYKGCEGEVDELLAAGVRVGVIWQDGRAFGGTHTIRMNLAVPHSMVQDVFERLDRYVFNA